VAQSCRRIIRAIRIIAILTVGTTTSGLAASGPTVHLPADQSAHAAAHNEWWYVVGHLRSASHTFGFEATVFRFSHIRPPGFSSDVSLDRTDVAITDEAGHRFFHRITFLFPGQASISFRTLSIAAGAIRLAGAPASMALAASLPAGAFSLHLSSRRPAMTVGGNGYIPFANGFTYYYSLTDLATTGTLTLKGVTYRVHGISWLDHQWGNWSWRAIHGWVWMALQLNNGTQLSLYDFRGTTRLRQANILGSGGRLVVTPGLTIRATGRWISPHTGGVYPSGWIVSIPRSRARLVIRPTVLDQEMTVPGEQRASYWEGSGHVSGTFEGHPVTGNSYTELTGYAG
jgi:predicted secreted hydrolase